MKTLQNKITTKRYLPKIVLTCLSILVVAGSLYYTHNIAKELARQERERIEIWSGAISELSLKSIESPEEDVSFVFGIVQRNNNIPAVLVNESGQVVATTKKGLAQEDWKGYFEQIKSNATVIPIETDYFSQKVYFEESTLLKLIKLFPYIQLSVIAVLGLLGYLLFDSARKAEQNKVWVGMAKETAHQLGTPISSLMGWIESLKITDDDPSSKSLIIEELTLDTERLQLIADRFSKIGSPPALEIIEINALVKSYFDYLRVRAPRKISFEFDSTFEETLVKGNTLLLSWVLENLMKNAIDAMAGVGHLKVMTDKDGDKTVFIDIVDTGKGIQKSLVTKIFEPGFTTKKRGWGLGLSLAKRIIEGYHSGKIFVKSSDMNVGTTFRIVLKNAKS